MPVETLFFAANFLALTGWAVLALAPLRRGVFIAAARWVAAILGGAYFAILLYLVGGGGNGLELTMTAAGLAALFSRPEVLLLGWIHYLAFDLWIGAWIAQDARERRIPHGIVLPCLILTYFAGPVGLLIFLIVRFSRPRDHDRRAQPAS